MARIVQPKVTSDMNQTLKEPFTESEVVVSISQMLPCKSPKPDGGKKGYAAIKLDMSKAYDRVEWRSLESMLISGEEFGHVCPQRDSARAISHLLHRYEAASGQKVNLAKSSMVLSSNIPATDYGLLGAALGVDVVPKHDKYLGLPAVGGRSKKEMFDSIRIKVWIRIQGWNSKFLSQTGKEILIKIVIQSIPTYAMSCFKLLLTFVRELESMMTDFWWNNKGNSRVHWVAWRKLCMRKGSGGLGFRQLAAFNDALLSKQAWRIIQHPESLVGRLYRARYFQHSDFFNARLGSRPSFTWWSILSTQGLVITGARWRVGNGAKIRIWEDLRFLGNRAFAYSYKFNRGRFGCESLIDLVVMYGKPTLCSSFSTLDVELILAIPLGRSSNEDRLVWHPDSRRNFTVRSAHHLALKLVEINKPSHSGPTGSIDSSHLDWKFISKRQVPNKVKTFG
ncbi:UNVERIFIED_CONTAM: putative mitochondrial protein [Sesamum latifolium]|uniref:Mitochondrial protein n=1 Tax=Sesamum latifolium TaxID=2727402 RepID=A0AAW2TCJ0_9LAMI